MIGVISKSGQESVVEEFFQLFKTPWEFWRAGRAYDVVICTADEKPEFDAKLIVVHGSASQNADSRLGGDTRDRNPSAILSGGDTWIPIYRGLMIFADSYKGAPLLKTDAGIAGLKVCSANSTVIRLGYDLFDEVEFLLSPGQPVENAHIPALDLHIETLRTWILDAGVDLLEIPPTPSGHPFIVCLTHDIDFSGIRNHLFDHSMWGFVYRATFGAVRNFLRGRLSFKRLLQCWLSVASLPFVYAGWMKDFWEPFEWYLDVERNLPATYFLIPFKRRAGEKVPNRQASRRATAYDVGDLVQSTAVLLKHGCELGVHGIDSWHSEEKGREELARIASISGDDKVGIRMHWLLRDKQTAAVLESAGYAYDSTSGYNDTVGYRNGTTQAFRPLGVRALLELPLHIQDGALFYPNTLDLSGPEAANRCRIFIENANQLGGMLTILWHDRSHAPERFWGDFYVELVQTLRASGAWFGTGLQVAAWFQRRRDVRFERLETKQGVRTTVHGDVNESLPPLSLRLYVPSKIAPSANPPGRKLLMFTDTPWDGKMPAEIDSSFHMASGVAVGLSPLGTHS